MNGDAADWSMSVDAPLHGFHGDAAAPLAQGPEGVTVAISREAGARGFSIAQILADRLGWQVYGQEHLDFLLNDEQSRAHVLTDVPHEAAQWAEAQLDSLKRRGLFADSEANLAAQARLILTLAARGRVMPGRPRRGLLPADGDDGSHARVIAPPRERGAYMAERLPLTPEESDEVVRGKDEQRSHFLFAHFGRRAIEPRDFDLMLNSSSLGEDLAATLIADVVRAKEARLAPPPARLIDPILGELTEP